MKRRLFWATLLLCPTLVGMAISPGHGQATRTVDHTSATRAPSAALTKITVQTPAAMRNGLRYFRFSAGGRMADTAAPSDRSTPVVIPMPDVNGDTFRGAGDACRRGIDAVVAFFSHIGEYLAGFGNRCRDTANRVANLCNVIADSCRRLRDATAGFSSSEAQAAAPPAGTPTSQVAVSGGYRYTWTNERGDRIFSQDPQFNPNHGGKPVWQRTER